MQNSNHNGVNHNEYRNPNTFVAKEFEYTEVKIRDRLHNKLVQTTFFYIRGNLALEPCRHNGRRENR
ncbi:hypothetical protein D3C86_2001560 [compost metagenome]